MTAIMLAAVLTIGPPTFENLGVLHRQQADEFFADQFIPPTWFLDQGWDDPALAPTRNIRASAHASVPGSGPVTRGWPAPPAELETIVRDRAAAYGWGEGPEWDALVVLLWKESGWRPDAQNPHSTAYGIAQFLDSTWASTGIEKTSDPDLQAAAMMIYVSDRYGSPSAALAFHRRNNWY